MARDDRPDWLRDLGHDPVARRTGYTKDEVAEFVIVCLLLIPTLGGIVLMSLWLFA